MASARVPSQMPHPTGRLDWPRILRLLLLIPLLLEASRLLLRTGAALWGLLEAPAAALGARRVYAITGLTFKAALRYRLVQVLLVLLLGAVVGLPAIIKHDGTAQGFTQILLTYTLGSISLLLGFATLWLGCGTLSRDIEECQMQVVAIKPIPRWQIWLGKWLGIVALNALLLGITGLTLFLLVLWRASQLPANTQVELQRTIFVARGSIKETVDYTAIQDEAQRLLQERLKQQPLTGVDRGIVRTQLVETVKSRFQEVRSGTVRRWELNLGGRSASLRSQPLTLRTKFQTANEYSSTTCVGAWLVGPPDGRRVRIEADSLASATFHEFALPPGLIDERGVLTVDFFNFNPTSLLFSLEEGLEILYPEASFSLNYARGLGIVLCWLALLAAIGLATGSFLSFPVAAFCALGILIVSSSTSTLRQVVEEGGISAVNANTGRIEEPRVIDQVAVPVFKALLWTIELVRGFSPVDSLSTGRSVSWTELARAFCQVVLLMGGLFAAFGIAAFTRRELATAQGP